MKTRMKVSRCCCDGGAPNGDYCDSCCDQDPASWSPDNEIDVTIGSFTATLSDDGVNDCCHVWDGPVQDGTPAIWWYVAQISGVCYMFVGVHCNDEGYLCDDLELEFDSTIPGPAAYYRKALTDQDCEGAFPITLDLEDSKGTACSKFGTAGTWPATISLVLS